MAQLKLANIQICEQSNVAQPFIKWAGGKRQILNELISRLPKSYGRYFEPFIGGGALFFALKPENAYISDINPELVNVYSIIKNNLDSLINDLKKHENNFDYYIKIRDIDRAVPYKNWSNTQKASRFIYLNRTCYNGLYRVNSKGQFNVPFGKYSNPKILNENNLKSCSKVLQSTEIKLSDFSNIINYVQKGDFVYFDPPYVPLNETSSFTSYTKEGFDTNMQNRLKKICDLLDEKGVYFMLSNSDTKIINDLYNEYKIEKIFATRAINSNANRRGKICEVLVRNY